MVRGSFRRGIWEVTLMYKRFFPLFCLFLSLMLTACAAPPESAPPSQTVASSPSAAATPSPETAQPTPSVDAAPTSAPTSASPSVLVAYFSCTGGTEAVAQHIAGALDAQLYAIRTGLRATGRPA